MKRYCDYLMDSLVFRPFQSALTLATADNFLAFSPPRESSSMLPSLVCPLRDRDWN